MQVLIAAIFLALPCATSAQTLYITNEADNVTVLDAAAEARTGHIEVGGTGPRGIAVTHDGKWLLTANKDSGDLSLIDRASGRLEARIPIGVSPEMVRVHGHMAFVTYEPPTDKGGLAHVAVVDLDRRRVLRSAASGHETEGLEFSADGKYLLVANEGDDSVSIYELPDLKLARLVNTAAYGTRPRGIKRLPDGSGYIVTLELSAKFIVLDSNFDFVKAVGTATGPYGAAFSPDGTHLFVAAARAGRLQEFDAKTFAHIGDADVGKRCWHFVFSSDGRRIFAACGRSNAMYVVDAANLTRVRTIRDFSLPWGLVAYPATSGTLDAP